MRNDGIVELITNGMRLFKKRYCGKDEGFDCHLTFDTF